MPSFGAKLKQEREQRGVSLEEISASTKISTRMLHALEEDRFEQLPGGIFNKGFIRAYARTLGMDEDEVIADYLAATSPPEKEAKPAAEERPAELRIQEVKNPASGLPWEAFAIVLLIAAIAFAVWGVRSRQRTKPAENSAQLQSVPVSPSNTVPASSSQSPAPTRGPAVAPANPTPPPVAALSLRIKATGDCWISVKSDGHEILRDTLLAPTEKLVHASKQIIVKAGDISALDFEFNGKKVPSEGEEGEVKTLIFDAAGWRTASPPPQPPSVEPASQPQP